MPSPAVFDTLIDKALVERGCRNNVPFQLTKHHDTKHLCYSAEFQLETDDPDIHSRLSIRVYPAGKAPGKDGDLFISPSGGSDTTVVPTHDGLFDIEVTQYNKGKMGVASPVILTDTIATEVVRRYKERQPGAPADADKPHR